MALLQDLKKGLPRKKVNIHKPVKAGYYILGDDENGKILQIDTYGSDERAIPGKVSQTIQLSPKVIAQLKEIFEKEF
jgi:hypothetical protein